MTNEQLSCYLSGGHKEDTTVGLYEDIQDYDTLSRTFERTETVGRFSRLLPRFVRDDRGATTIEFGVIAVGLSAIGYVVVQTLLKANWLG